MSGVVVGTRGREAPAVETAPGGLRPPSPPSRTGTRKANDWSRSRI